MLIFNRISEKVVSISTEFPSASFHICSDFNIHHKEGLVYLNKIDEEGRYCEDFTIAHELKSLKNSPVFLMQQAIIQTSLASSSYPALKKCFG